MTTLLALSTGFYVAIGIEAVLAVAAVVFIVWQCLCLKKVKGKSSKCVTVTFETNGGTAVGVLEGKAGKNMAIDSTVREGYEFDGWYRDEELTVRAVDTIFPYGDATYYAKWLEANDVEAENETVSEPYMSLSQYNPEIDANIPSFMPQQVNATDATSDTAPGSYAEAVDNASLAAADTTEDDGTIIKITGKTETLQEAYEGLSKEQKSFYKEIKNYALGKEGAKLTTAKGHEKIKVGNAAILKLRIKRNITVAIFSLENELLKKYRKEDSKDVAIKVKETEVPVSDLDALRTAKDMVDMSVEQMLKEKEEKELERKEKRKQNKN